MMVNSCLHGLIPRLDTFRRVPGRYQHILPLALMKHLHCIVVGAERGALTIAIADTKQIEVIAPLEKITGRRIFVVLVDNAHLRLLIARLERNVGRTPLGRIGCPHYLHRLQLQSYTRFLIDKCYLCQP